MANAYPHGSESTIARMHRILNLTPPQIVNHLSKVKLYCIQASLEPNVSDRLVLYSSHTPQYALLSNMAFTPFDCRVMGSSYERRYHSVEQGYQHAKMLACHAPQGQIDRLLHTRNPFLCKQLGSEVPEKASIQWKHGGGAVPSMQMLLNAKFRQRHEACQQLLNTQSAYLGEHTSSRDQFWSVGADRQSKPQWLWQPREHLGLNRHGLQLMGVRATARAWGDRCGVRVPKPRIPLALSLAQYKLAMTPEELRIEMYASVPEPQTLTDPDGRARTPEFLVW